MRVEKIENIVSKLDEIQVGGAAMASVTWSYGMTMVNHMARMERIHNPDDIEFGTLREDAKTDRLASMERRLNEITTIIGWASSNANPDFLPTGAEIVKLALNGNPMASSTSSDEIQNFAKTMDISTEDATTILARSEEHLAEVRALNLRAAEIQADRFAAAIDTAIGSWVHDGWDLEPRDAARIAERLAEKAEQYEQKRLERAAFTRRARRLAQLGAERKLLADVMNDADDLAAEFLTEVENMTTTSEVFDLAAA